MDDLVKRLRGWPPSIAHNVMQDAADRIEALEARIAKADALADAVEFWEIAEEPDVNDAICGLKNARAAYREGSDT